MENSPPPEKAINQAESPEPVPDNNTSVQCQLTKTRDVHSELSKAKQKIENCSLMLSTDKAEAISAAMRKVFGHLESMMDVVNQLPVSAIY